MKVICLSICIRLFVVVFSKLSPYIPLSCYITIHQNSPPSKSPHTATVPSTTSPKRVVHVYNKFCFVYFLYKPCLPPTSLCCWIPKPELSKPVWMKIAWPAFQCERPSFQREREHASYRVICLIIGLFLFYDRHRHLQSYLLVCPY